MTECTNIPKCIQRLLMTSFFSTLATLPEDPILGLQRIFLEDERKDKLNLGIGIYPDKEGNTYLFRAVREAEKRIGERGYPKNYQLIEGDKPGRKFAETFLFRGNNKYSHVSCQTLGGTGALRLAGDMAARLGRKEVAFPAPTWSNYKQIFGASGLQMKPITYYDKVKGEFLREPFFKEVEALPKSAVLVLQGPCQNPTGCDFGKEDRERMAALVREKGLFLILDIAYLGYGDGLEKDLATLDPYLQGECFIALSFSKTLSLYGDRVGFLFANVEKGREEALSSQIRESVRSAYSSPPLHGNLLIQEIFKDEALVRDWKKELENSRLHLVGMREHLADALQKKDKTRDYQYLKKLKGMFSLFDLPEAKILELRKNFRIYLPSNGRVNIAGLEEKTIPLFIDALFA